MHRPVGMWSFVLLDLEQRCLFLSRDRFGIEPLFYSIVRGQFRSASEIKALLEIGDVELEPDDDAVRRFILIGHVDASDESFFRGIFHLPPAHNAVVALDGVPVVRPIRYWRWSVTSAARADAAAGRSVLRTLPFSNAIRQSHATA